MYEEYNYIRLESIEAWLAVVWLRLKDIDPTGEKLYKLTEYINTLLLPDDFEQFDINNYKRKTTVISIHDRQHRPES